MVRRSTTFLLLGLLHCLLNHLISYSSLATFLCFMMHNIFQLATNLRIQTEEIQLKTSKGKREKIQSDKVTIYHK